MRATAERHGRSALPAGHAECRAWLATASTLDTIASAMDAFFDELMAGMPDTTQVARIVFRLAIAALLGGIIGAQRERAGKEAGLRTHMLVALGAALFIVAPIESGMSNEDLARVIQGLIAGIGFLCAGAILKLTDEKQIKGLTTAAGLWLTAAVGVAAGLGRWGSAVVGVALIWLILDVVARAEARLRRDPLRDTPAAGDTER